MNWLARHIPTRDSIHRYRALRPFAPHLSQPALWRMTRRSVPRGVALGLFVAVIIPVMHTFIAALLAIPARANIAIAAAFTLVVNPLTIPPLYYAAYRIGSWELHHDAPLVNPAAAEPASLLDPRGLGSHRGRRAFHCRDGRGHRLLHGGARLALLAIEQAS